MRTRLYIIYSKFNNLLSLISIHVFNVILVILGLLMLSFYIWFRYIRQRLPRDIPFELYWFGTFILLYICCIYIYLLVYTIYKIKIKNDSFHDILTKLLIPLVKLDLFFKHNKYCQPYYYKALKYLVNKLKFLNDYYNPNRDLNSYHTWNHTYLVLIFEIFPRILLVSALLIDTFYFQCLFLIYKVIPISILILLKHYILYSFKVAKEEYIIKLETFVESVYSKYPDPDKPYYIFDEDKDDEDDTLPVRLFIEQQIHLIWKDRREYEHEPNFTDKYYLDFYKRRNLPFNYHKSFLNSEERKELRKEYDDIMDILIPLYIHIEDFDLVNDFSIIKKCKILLYSILVIVWNYILFVSIIYTNHITDLEIFYDVIDKIEPFSHLSIEMFYVENRHYLDKTKAITLYIEYMLPYIDKIEPFSNTTLSSILLMCSIKKENLKNYRNFNNYIIKRFPHVNQLIGAINKNPGKIITPVAKQLAQTPNNNNSTNDSNIKKVEVTSQNKVVEAPFSEMKLTAEPSVNELLDSGEKLKIIKYSDAKTKDWVYDNSGLVGYTELGNTLYNQVSQQAELINNPISIEKYVNNTDYPKIAGTIEISPLTVVTLPIQTHIVMGFYIIVEETKFFVIDSYLTSTIENNNKIANEQIYGNKKAQYVHYLQNPIYIPANEFKLHTDANEFINRPEIANKLADLDKQILKDKYAVPLENNPSNLNDLRKIVEKSLQLEEEKKKAVEAFVNKPRNSLQQEEYEKKLARAKIREEYIKKQKEEAALAKKAKLLKFASDSISIKNYEKDDEKNK